MLWKANFLISVSLLSLLLLVIICSAKPAIKAKHGKEHRNKAIHRRLSTDAKEKLRKNCIDDNGTNKCQGQKEEHKKRRDVAKKALTELTAFENGIDESEAEAIVERRLAKIQALKKAWYRHNDLDDVEPADDGFWKGDMILTEAQAEAAIAYLNASATDENANPGPPGPRRRKRSAAIYFEQSPDQKWSFPIHFWISPAFTSTEQSVIRSAISAITAAAPCILFVEDDTAITSGFQIQYRLNTDGFCGGFATVGRWGIQAVSLNFCASSTTVAQGLVIHETIHALGGDHEQSRVDRDYYIAVLYDNIDPQYAYAYDIAFGSTSYGVVYDYNSIMHYYNGAFAIDPSKPTMDAIFDGFSLGSQDVLTTGDKLQLNRMYCRPASCVDSYAECGLWAVEEYCHDADWGRWMSSNCGKSCDGLYV